MAANFIELTLPGVFEVLPVRHRDDRGFFSEVFRLSDFSERGLPVDWIQDNHSLSTQQGVLRGLHYQRPPHAQDKLVRVVRGSILDVVVDIRRESPTYARWVSLVISAEKWNQVLVPKGFAHGFVTLEPDTEVNYKVTAAYSREHDAVIRYDDPEIGVDWQLGDSRPKLSAKDLAAALLCEQDTGFVYTESQAREPAH